MKKFYSDWVQRFYSYVEIPTDENACHIWVAGKNKGYGVFNPPGRGPIPAHRVAWEIAFNIQLKTSQWILHHCDTPACVNVKHLYIGKPKDNTRDMWARGRGKVPNNAGRKNGRAKLTFAIVTAIRSDVAAGARQKDVASKYGYSITGVSEIITGKIWKQE